jgi:hypothetical protein
MTLLFTDAMLFTAIYCGVCGWRQESVCGNVVTFLCDIRACVHAYV